MGILYSIVKLCIMASRKKETAPEVQQPVQVSILKSFKRNLFFNF